VAVSGQQEAGLTVAPVDA
jgi:hypothetical protein